MQPQQFVSVWCEVFGVAIRYVTVFRSVRIQFVELLTTLSGHRDAEPWHSKPNTSHGLDSYGT